MALRKMNRSKYSPPSAAATAGVPAADASSRGFSPRSSPHLVLDNERSVLKSLGNHTESPDTLRFASPSLKRSQTYTNGDFDAAVESEANDQPRRPYSTRPSQRASQQASEDPPALDQLYTDLGYGEFTHSSPGSSEQGKQRQVHVPRKGST